MPGSTLSTILKVSPATIKIMPETPATPKPGIANISTVIRIIPTIKTFSYS